MNKSAAISACGQYRYALSREWATGPVLVFIMLNPSTADANTDDATIRKCIGFATRHGFGSIEVYNLFAFRATNPKDLAAAGYPGNGDSAHDRRLCESLRARTIDDSGLKVVCAWGANARNKVIGGRANQLCGEFAMYDIPLHYLEITADGIPHHPLMLSYEVDDGAGGKKLRPLTPWVVNAAA